jgi:hypothetical protein
VVALSIAIAVAMTALQGRLDRRVASLLAMTAAREAFPKPREGISKLAKQKQRRGKQNPNSCLPSNALSQ